jgi:hypothetical protein
MTPKGRSYGTLEMQGTICYPVVHTVAQSPYIEDYDEWAIHTCAAGETTYDSGTFASSDYVFAVEESLHQISFPTEDSDAASAPFPVLGHGELKEYMATFHDGGMNMDDDGSSI